MSKQTFHFKCYIVSLFILCLIIFSACENPADDTTQPDPPPKTQVEFTNLEQYSATIYSDPARQNIITDVAANGTTKIDATPAPAGVAFYPTFRLDIFDIPGISVPYNAPHIMATIEDRKTANVRIPKLESIEINSAYIKIKNDSIYSFSLRQGNTELLTLGGRIIIVMSGQNVVYEVTPGFVSSYTFMKNGDTPVAFPAGLTEFRRGIIYVLTYNGTSLTLTKETSVLQTIPPSTPENIHAEMVSNSSVRLTWNEVSGAISYKVYRATGSSAASYTLVGTPTNAFYNNTALSAGQAYYYKITALSSENKESAQSTAAVAIMPPVNVRVTATTAKSVSLAWNAFSGASGYNIYCSDSVNGNYSKVNTAAVTGTVFTDPSLLQDAIYWYKVSAIVGGTEGLLSGQIPASTSSIPRNVRVTATTAKSVSLAWNVVSEASGYHVYRSDSENGIYSKVNTAVLIGTVFTDTSPSQDATYWYKVSAIIVGAEGLLSSQIPASTSSIPGNVRITSSDTIRVVLAWNVVSEASGYNVYRSATEAGAYNKVNTAALTDTGFTDTGLSPDTTYWYKISAIIDGTEGLQSIQISASTLTSIPGNVRVTSSDTIRVVLAWNAVSEASGYHVYRSDSENGIYNRINTGTVTGTGFTDTNVSAYTTYFYKVSAIISGIEGIQSSPVSASAGVMVPGNGLAAKLSWLQTNALSNSEYMIEVTVAESIGPTTLSYSNRTNIGIILRGTVSARTVSLSSNGTLFTVASGVTLVLDNNITLQGRSSNNNSLVRVNAGGTLVMNTGSRITGNTSSYGGGVYVSGTFTMNGGKISGNTVSNYGGGVYMNSGTFTMHGGEISGNTVSNYGGGVYVNGTFTMNDGEISGNTADYRGGGVYVNSGTFTMSGGKITGNTTNALTSSYGGGVAVNGSFTMSGGKITGNTANASSGSSYGSAYGGGVAVINGGTFTMSGGEISGNSTSDPHDSPTYGGGVYMGSNGTFTKSGNSIITGWGDDTVNGNVVKSFGIVQSNRGHAVYSSSTKKREKTVYASENMDLSKDGAAGGWVDP